MMKVHYRSEEVSIVDMTALKFFAIKRLADTIVRNGWTQKTAAKKLGIDQPKVSHIINNKIAGFSLERLLILLNMVGYDMYVHLRD